MKHSYAMFFREYLKNYREIGSVVPDSKWCLDVMLRLVPFYSAGVIIEFGAASGAMTREIVRRKKKETVFFAFEKNPIFYNRLQETIVADNVFLVNASVFECVPILANDYGYCPSCVDCIISTLPCSNIDVDRLLQYSVLPLLNQSGLFVQYMHVLSMLKGFHLGRILASYFKQVVPDFVLGNIPPVYVYNCTGKPS